MLVVSGGRRVGFGVAYEKLNLVYSTLRVECGRKEVFVVTSCWRFGSVRTLAWNRALTQAGLIGK